MKLKFTFFIILLAFVTDFGHFERFKRDDARFASDFGGPLARSSETGSLPSAGLMNQTTMDDLLPCELLPDIQHQQPIANLSDPGTATNMRLGRKKKEISYDGFRPKNNNNQLPPRAAFQPRAVNRPIFYQPSFTSEYQLPYHRPFEPRPNIDAMLRVPFQQHFGVCQPPYRLSTPPIYSRPQNPYAPTQGPYAPPQQSYYQAPPPVTVPPTTTTTVPPPTTTAPDPFVEKFDNFLKRFNKTYPPGFDVEKAMRNFVQNEKLVAKFGNERRSPYDAQVDVTKFSDENFFDFRAAHTGAFLAENKTSIGKISGESLQKPKCQKLQWTDKNVFPAARNQKSCGACYAMTTADLLAAQSKIELKNFDTPVKPLSAQYLVDCLAEPDTFKCEGGRPINILNRLAKCQQDGTPCMLPAEDCYPYTAVNNTCNDNCTREMIKINDAEMLDVRGPREMDVMATLLQWGPVIAIVGVTEVWQFYNGTGVVRPRQCSTDLAHAVLVTGYDYTTCVPTYTVRNSWGQDWGGNGYLKLEAGKNTCGVAQSVVYTCSTRCGSKKPLFDFVAQNPNFPDC